MQAPKKRRAHDDDGGNDGDRDDERGAAAAAKKGVDDVERTVSEPVLPPDLFRPERASEREENIVPVALRKPQVADG